MKRLVSAIIMILVFIPLLILGKVPYLLLMMLLSLLALKEIFSLEKDLPSILKFIGYCIDILGFVYFYFFNKLFDYRIVLLIFLIYSIMIVIINNLDKYNYKNSEWLTFNVLLISSCFINLVYLRNINMYIIVYLFLISCSTDTFALLFGKMLGKHKLSPSISPNKTVEGSLFGSLIGSVISCVFYLLFINKSANILLVVGITIILSILGQIGDLYFSSIKRYHKTKDFSNLIPGHGGILDRLDSTLFVSIGYLLIMIFL